MFTIKVGQLPGRIEEFSFEDGSTVQDALELAGLSAEGFEVRVDGTQVSVDTVLTDDNNMVLLVKKIKGNTSIVLKVGQLPGRINEYVVESGMKVQDAIDMADLSTEGYEVRVNGSVVSDLSSNVIVEDSIVLLVKKIKGN